MMAREQATRRVIRSLQNDGWLAAHPTCKYSLQVAPKVQP